MARFGSKLRTLEGGRVVFHCPACRTGHPLRIDPALGSAWRFNGNGDAPTFTPSVLVQGHQLETDQDGRWTGEWIRDAEGQPLPSICHSFVTDGRIAYLADSTHALAGQTVDLPDFPGGGE